MSRRLCLSATLLAGRYHAEEWPPSPARAFQALLAGVMTGGYRIHQERAEAALRWLETLGPPEIVAVREQDLHPYRLAVPNNDFDVVAREWAKRKAADPAKLRTLKTVQPKLLPGSGPHVHYLWDVSHVPEAERQQHAEALKQTASCLHTLGWGVDMAFAGAALVDDEAQLQGDRWRCSSSGTQLAVPIPGLLADLRQAYLRFTRRTQGAGVDPDTRANAFGFAFYARAGERKRPLAAFALLNPETERPYSRGPHESMLVAAWLRHAAAQALRPLLGDDRTNSYVLGHVEEGDRSHRLSFLPLLSVGHRHADGRIRRALILEPEAAEGDVARLLEHTMKGAALIQEGSTSRICSLAPAHLSDPVIANYTSSSAIWNSVSPVILHGFNRQRGQLSLRKTDRLLREAFTESGYPAESIRSIAFQPAPLVAGAVSARDVAVPRHLAQWPRYHVSIEFTNPLRGPVLAGIGRHYGIGLFTPLR